MDKSKVPRFYGSPCIILVNLQWRIQRMGAASGSSLPYWPHSFYNQGKILHKMHYFYIQFKKQIWERAQPSPQNLPPIISPPYIKILDLPLSVFVFTVAIKLERKFKYLVIQNLKINFFAWFQRLSLTQLQYFAYIIWENGEQEKFVGPYNLIVFLFKLSKACLFKRVPNFFYNFWVVLPTGRWPNTLYARLPNFAQG